MVTNTIIIGGDPPTLIGHSVDIPNNQLFVSWSTSITEIVTIAVRVKNTVTRSESTMFVGWNERNASIPVDPPYSYDVSVVVFDMCRQELNSEVVTVTGRVELSSVPEKSFIISSTPPDETSSLRLFSSEPSMTCDQEKNDSGENTFYACYSIIILHSFSGAVAGVIALSILFSLSVVTLIFFVAIVAIWCVYCKKPRDSQNQGRLRR